MVAITVLLAATVATVFLGYGDHIGGEQPPNLVFDTDFGSDGASHELDVSVTGGETVDRDNLQVVVSDASCGTGDPNHRYRPALLGVASTELMAGSTVHVDDRLCASGPLDLSDATVSVVWVASDGGSGRRLLVWEGPRA